MEKNRERTIDEIDPNYSQFSEQTLALLHPRGSATKKTIKKCVSESIGKALLRNSSDISLSKREIQTQYYNKLSKDLFKPITTSYIAECKKIFQVYDFNKQGFIDVDTFQHFLASIKKNVTEGKIRSIIHRKGGHPDRITLAEFTDICPTILGKNQAILEQYNCRTNSLGKLKSMPSFKQLGEKELEASRLNLANTFSNNITNEVFNPKRLSENTEEFLEAFRKFSAENKVYSRKQRRKSKNIHNLLHEEMLDQQIIPNYSTPNLRSNISARIDHVDKMMLERAKKRENRVQNATSANHFTRSIGLLGRQSGFQEIEKQRRIFEDYLHELVDDRKRENLKMQLRHQAQDEIQLIERKKFVQDNRKKLDSYELNLHNEEVKRIQNIRQQKQLFKISPSTSTLPCKNINTNNSPSSPKNSQME